MKTLGLALILAFGMYSISYTPDANAYTSFGFDAVMDYLASLVHDAVAWAVIQGTKAAIAFQIWALQFSYEVATSIIEQLGVSQLLNEAWGRLDSKIIAALNYFRVPDAINLIVSAGVTRYVLNVVPFL